MIIGGCRKGVHKKGHQSVNAGASGSLLVATCAENYNNGFSGIAGDNQDWGGNTI